MRIFIVHAHPEPTSFNGAMTRAAIRALPAAGHEVVVSDLYAMRFDPVSDRRNFITVKDPERLKQQDEEAYASEHNGFVAEIQAEMDKLAWCDALIFQFPIWWLGLPAILKGWVDRIFAVGRAYGGGKYFGRGVFTGKRAMCSVTVGGPSAAYSESGMYGPIASILFPIHRGILSFVGFTVIEPFVVYGPSRISHEERVACLTAYRERLLSLETAPTISHGRCLPPDLISSSGDPRRARQSEKHRQINQAFRLRGINPAGDQRGCSPPLETPFDGARSKLRGILDLVNANDPKLVTLL